MNGISLNSTPPGLRPGVCVVPAGCTGGYLYYVLSGLASERGYANNPGINESRDHEMEIQK